MVMTVVLLAAFWYLVQHTSLGRAQRACEQDRKMAALLGIDVDATISITFVIGAALAAVAGVMFVIYYGVVNFADGFVPGVKAFTAAVLGGSARSPARFSAACSSASSKCSGRPISAPTTRTWRHS